MHLRVKCAWFVNPAAIAARNETYLNADKSPLLDLELVPQGLLVRVKGWKGGPFIVGNTNLRSVELYEEPAHVVVPASPELRAAIGEAAAELGEIVPLPAEGGAGHGKGRKGKAAQS